MARRRRVPLAQASSRAEVEAARCADKLAVRLRWALHEGTSDLDRLRAEAAALVDPVERLRALVHVRDQALAVIPPETVEHLHLDSPRYQEVLDGAA